MHSFSCATALRDLQDLLPMGCKLIPEGFVFMGEGEENLYGVA